MIRRVFLECFGASMTQRAENFSAIFSEGGAGERAEVTAHQLRRYFGLCGTPSIAKVRISRMWYVINRVHCLSVLVSGFSPPKARCLHHLFPSANLCGECYSKGKAPQN